MVKSNAIFWTMTGSAVLVGFMVGYGVGQGTKEATPDNVKAEVNGGIVTITANLAGALKDGIGNWLDSL